MSADGQTRCKVSRCLGCSFHCSKPSVQLLLLCGKEELNGHVLKRSKLKWSISITWRCSGRSRISPRWGRQPFKRGANIWFCKILTKNAWNWKNLDPRGRACVPRALSLPPLRSATGWITGRFKVWAVIQLSVASPVDFALVHLRHFPTRFRVKFCTHQPSRILIRLKLLEWEIGECLQSIWHTRERGCWINYCSFLHILSTPSHLLKYITCKFGTLHSA